MTSKKPREEKEGIKVGGKPEAGNKPEAEPEKKMKDEGKPEAEEKAKTEPKKKQETKPTAKPKKKTEEETEDEKKVKATQKSLGKSDDTTSLEDELSFWTPKTELGRRVHKGEITLMHEVIRLNTPIKEVEIVSKLLPELEEEILNVGRVQRATDSGRRMRFRIATAVGNGNGFVGVGVAKGKEAGPTIRKAIKRAKLNIAEIKRGCGSWECGCGNPHTVPTKVSGKSGSVEVILMPAPRGVGLVCGEITRKILALAGIADVWTITTGHTRTSINLAFAVYNALVNTNYVKFKEQDIEKLGVKTGQT